MLLDSVATVKQGAPHGKGRDITKLVQEDVLTQDFLIPEQGYKTIELWIRSAALYVKGRVTPTLEDRAGESTRGTLDLAHAVIRDFEERAAMGEKKYGERLRAHNGRNAEIDLLQELYDSWLYMRQKREESEVHK